MANIGEQIESKANGAARNMSHKAQELGGQLEKASHELGSKFGSVVSDVSEKASDYVDTTRTMVKERPLQSILVAAAAGVAVGTLVTMAARGSKH